MSTRRAFLHTIFVVIVALLIHHPSPFPRHMMAQGSQAEEVVSVAWSPDGEKLALGLSGNAIQVWSIVTKQHLATFQGHTQRISSLSWSPDGGSLASASDDGM